MFNRLPNFIFAHLRGYPMDFSAEINTFDQPRNLSLEILWLCNILDIYQGDCTHKECDKNLTGALIGAKCFNLTKIGRGNTPDKEQPLLQYHFWQNHHMAIFRLTKQATWEESSDQCKLIGGHLPVFNSREDVRNVVALMMTSSPFFIRQAEVIPLGLKLWVSILYP